MITPEDRAFWEAAVNERHSCRSYKPTSVESGAMQRLKAFAAGLALPFDWRGEFRFFQTAGRPIANNLKVPPPDAVAFLSETDPLSVAKTGFAGELLLLYATGLQINSCWFGHYLLVELERCMPHLGEHAAGPLPAFGYGRGEVPGRRALCLSPLGYWEEKGLRLVDRLSSGLMSFKRKPLGALMTGPLGPEALSPELRHALELAVKAPSAANTQHWRFNVSADQKTVTVACLPGFRHFRWEHFDMDIGICASHLWLGLRTQGINCTAEPLPGAEEGHIAWKFSL
ncbi:MAG: hypothetical protein LBD02_02205 [Christensenellaceae bacterium]|jgi:nitroreductase|nr:hypothetical protein [Christensenellaceae bacterium]